MRIAIPVPKIIELPRPLEDPEDDKFTGGTRDGQQEAGEGEDRGAPEEDPFSAVEIGQPSEGHEKDRRREDKRRGDPACMVTASIPSSLAIVGGRH
ncbi:MAG: hypothetical protein MZV70_12450 [Desulfobacterales bacterium]|nr:hypothetical protein [Desulfobacterales bacterium]